jgi:hypothetical protein
MIYYPLALRVWTKSWIRLSEFQVAFGAIQVEFGLLQVGNYSNHIHDVVHFEGLVCWVLGQCVLSLRG